MSGNFNRTPLQTAIQSRDMASVASIVNAGNVNYANVDANHRTALYSAAAEWVEPTVVALLFSKGARFASKQESDEVKNHLSRMNTPAAASILKYKIFP